MRWRVLVLCLLAGCEPERQSTGAMRLADERAAAERVARVEQRRLYLESDEAKRARKAAADAAFKAARAIAAERDAKLAKEEAERQAALENYTAGVRLKLQCAKERTYRATRHASIDAVAASDNAKATRLTAVEKWIKARCRRLGQKVTHPEVQIAKDGSLIRKEVVVDLIPFWACPANTPEDVIRDGNLSDSELYGWHRFDDRAPTIPAFVTPVIIKAEHDAVDETQKADCKPLDEAAAKEPPAWTQPGP